MNDDDTPNRASNMEKAEADRWGSDSSTVERRERDLPGDADTDPQPAAGISNRPVGEEQENQASLPDRGEAKPGVHAGRRHHTPDTESR